MQDVNNRENCVQENGSMREGSELPVYFYCKHKTDLKKNSLLKCF